ncbi:hydrolase [Cystobacter fuscus]|uniref:cellulose binding domain-containing protein n=1 Tax=Cystobacter fuscus TaxID=43 RepID=UPI002B2ED11F|nr:hydrolase [Cystobacter fuscus]
MKSNWKYSRASLFAVMALVAPVGESLAGTNDVTVQYLNYNAAGPNDDIAEANIRLRNNTTAAIPLSSIVVRYWFTKDSASGVTAECWWWGASPCPNLTVTTGNVSYTGADRYAEIRFTSGAGNLAPGATTQAIDLGVVFGTNVDETNDYSYGSHTSFIDWSKITVHDAGSAPTEGLRGGTPPSGGGGNPGGGDTITTEFFDDFSYTSASDTNFRNWWNVRNDSNWTGPGPEPEYGAPWAASNVSIVTDSAVSGNKLLRLQTSTSGTNATTAQAEVSSKSRKFKFGTYAARVKFNNTPLSGTRYFADKPVETFFTITNYVLNDPNYSEQDFEYMPNGGWGRGNTSTLWMTSWEDTQLSVEDADRVSDWNSNDYSGWHTLVLQVSSTGIYYYIDGALLTSHTQLKYLPETNQSIYFNIWFAELDRTQTSSRAYHQEADWVYFAKDAVLTPAEVTSRIAGFRTAGTARKDTVVP